MFIVPMSPIVPLDSSKDKIAQMKPIGTISSNSVEETADEEQGASFIDVFKEAYQNVEETKKISNEDNAKLALGEIDDLSEISMNTQKAQIALQTFVTLKNSAVEAYKEIMQMTV